MRNGCYVLYVQDGAKLTKLTFSLGDRPLQSVASAADWPIAVKQLISDHDHRKHCFTTTPLSSEVASKGLDNCLLPSTSVELARISKMKRR